MRSWRRNLSNIKRGGSDGSGDGLVVAKRMLVLLVVMMVGLVVIMVVIHSFFYKNLVYKNIRLRFLENLRTSF